MGSFSIRKGELEKIVSAFMIKEPAIHDAMEEKMNLITKVVFKTATARRPKITASEFKSLGGKKGGYRVSDPNARLGVPVDTGKLQGSINMDVHWEGKKIIGEVDAGDGVEYAKMIEFGTSKMRPRPFMRPAWNENLQWIKEKWQEQITKI